MRGVLRGHASLTRTQLPASNGDCHCRRTSILLIAEPATPPPGPLPATDEAATGAEKGACQGC
jgi:hypothetical protein